MMQNNQSVDGRGHPLPVVGDLAFAQVRLPSLQQAPRIFGAALDIVEHISGRCCAMGAMCFGSTL